MKSKTPIIFIPDFCKKENAIWYLKDLKFRVEDLSINRYKYSRRPFTEEEIQRDVEIYNQTPHLLSGDGYANILRKRDVVCKNTKYPTNLLSDIEWMVDSYDYIFINFETDMNDIITTLKTLGYSVVVIYPSFNYCRMIHENSKVADALKLSLIITEIDNLPEDIIFHMSDLNGFDYYIDEDGINLNKDKIQDTWSKISERCKKEFGDETIEEIYSRINRGISCLKFTNMETQ